MKYNLRTLKGKRIVGGDPNLATKNEIHVTKIPEQLGIEGGDAADSTKYYQLNKIIDMSSGISDINGITIIYILVPLIATLVKSRRVSGLGGNAGYIGIPGSIYTLKSFTNSNLASDPEGFAISPAYFGTMIFNTDKDPNLVVDDRYYVGEDIKKGLYSFYYHITRNAPELNIISSKEDFFRYFDEFMSTYCVEVTKEQFFDFNYTLIKE